jgi:hypothetical protein
MSQPPPSAEIIAFPTPQKPVEDPRLRLQQALAALDAALAGQREAVAAWRGSLASLRGGMSDLRGSLERYSDALATMDRQVTGLGDTMRHLGGPE